MSREEIQGPLWGRHTSAGTRHSRRHVWQDSFSGKTAVVTGAASGIGRALADRCLAEGMNVVLADVEQEALCVPGSSTCCRIPNPTHGCSGALTA